jgi:hypothetical protein
MRKSTAAVAVASLLIGALALSGCTSWFESPNKPANAAIGVANGLLEKAASLDEQVKSDASSLQDVPFTKAGAKDALALTASIQTHLASERADLVAAKAAMDGIANLEVDKVLKRYAKLESSAIDARIVLADSEARLYTGFDHLYAALSESASKIDTQDTLTAIQEMQQEVTSFGESAANAAKAASDFFTTNKLGG